jgi:peptidoglycan/xylan/chitin deacetylase (PgdA/CDA1 family)
MNQMMATIVAVAMIAGTTIYEGLRFEFWNSSDPEELNRFVERLKQVPEKFGDWTSTESQVDNGQLGAAEIRGYVARDYVNSKTGAKVNIFLVCGKTHPMAIHSPDACYAAVGFKQGDPSRKYITVNGRQAEFWSSHFTRDLNLERQGLDIFWSWSPDTGNWEAPTNPRPHFSNKNALYKLYVITQPGEQSGNKAATEAFLEDFLPVLDKILFVPAEPKSPGDPETTA